MCKLLIPSGCPPSFSFFFPIWLWLRLSSFKNILMKINSIFCVSLTESNNNNKAYKHPLTPTYLRHLNNWYVPCETFSWLSSVSLLQNFPNHLLRFSIIQFTNFPFAVLPALLSWVCIDELSALLFFYL